MKNATAPHITPVTFPAPLAIDTRHVEDVHHRVGCPSYAIVSIQEAEWGWDADDDRRRVIIGSTITEPFAVRLTAGQSLQQVVKGMGYSPTFGQEIYTAIAIDRDDYQEFQRIQDKAIARAALPLPAGVF